MEGHCSTGQNPPRAVEPMEEEKKKATTSLKPTYLCVYYIFLNIKALFQCGIKQSPRF